MSFQPAQNLLLDQAEEDALHKHRLLPVEQRPFQRLAKKVLDEGSPARFNYSDGPFITPPPDSDSPTGDSSQNKSASTAVAKAQRSLWQAELKAELEAFRDSMIRIQLLANANQKDRLRYDGEREKVVQKMQDVRDNMALLREQLNQARDTMALRQQYDKLADEITRNRTLLPRDEQNARLIGLRADIAALQREREQYAQTWAERRVQFMRIVDEGKTMLSLIRDETKEADRKEGIMGRSSSVQPDGPGPDAMVTDEPEVSQPGNPSGESVPTIAVVAATTSTDLSSKGEGPDSDRDSTDREESKPTSSVPSSKRVSTSPLASRPLTPQDHLLSALKPNQTRSPSPLSRVVSPPQDGRDIIEREDVSSSSPAIPVDNDSDEDGEIVEEEDEEEAVEEGEADVDRMEDV